MTDKKPNKIRYGTECFATVNPIPGALIEFRLDDDGNICDRKIMCFYERHEVTYEQAKLIEKRMNDYQVMLEFIKSLTNLDDPKYYGSGISLFSNTKQMAKLLLKKIGEAE